MGQPHVEVLQPPQTHACQAKNKGAAHTSSGNAAEQVPQRPSKRHPWTTLDAALDLVAEPIQTAMSQQGEAGQVICAAVDLLHERDLGIDETAGREHPVNLVDDPYRIEHVLEHCLADDRVEFSE